MKSYMYQYATIFPRTTAANGYSKLTKVRKYKPAPLVDLTSDSEEKQEEAQEHSVVKLPKLSIKPFAGEPKQFIRFLQQFDAAVHKSKSLSVHRN